MLKQSEETGSVCGKGAKGHNSNASTRTEEVVGSLRKRKRNCASQLSRLGSHRALHGKSVVSVKMHPR
jgi:hypothetical protein